jgi:hypothetical protein
MSTDIDMEANAYARPKIKFVYYYAIVGDITVEAADDQEAARKFEEEWDRMTANDFDCRAQVVIGDAIPLREIE